ncbi:DUF885 domain-containing protein [Ferrimonas balearica]|uniref:DUF885 domain-containing protein n=1 Tax=Ferrimonas balearica TaxID=44012 RepID=UPI001C99473D|nr:DUF885 domain-containing protein [Ferrimonas balearica]MBY5993901.1 DUF885 domain-containing protein [Ferrimonas balearica]
MDPLADLNRAFLAFISHCPNACIELGLAQQRDRLPDPSEASHQQWMAKAQAVLDAADACGALSFDQEQDRQLMRLWAQRVRFEGTLDVDGHTHRQRLPKAGETISAGIFLLVTRDNRADSERLDDILGRIKQVPEYLHGHLAQLTVPLARWVQIDIETLAGLPELFDSIRHWAVQADYPALDSLTEAIAQANKAMAHYAEALEALPSSERFAIGLERAQRLVALNGVRLSLDEIHQVTRQFVSRTQGQIASLHRALVQRYQLGADTTVAELQAFLHRRYAVPLEGGQLASVIDRYHREAEKIEAFVRQHDLFVLPEAQSMTIMQTPAFMAPMIPAGAMMQPAALAEGTKTSQVYLTLSEALLDEHTELGIPVMMMHEGIPGHHLQLATAALHPTMVRRAFPAIELAEGWATMLEDYMLDLGYMGELTDEARFIAKLDLSRISARVAIDLYFMTGNADYLEIGYPLTLDSEDPFVNAGRLLKAVTGFTDERVEGELNWYSQERGYPLSYLVGNHLVWGLKRDFDAAQAEQQPDPRARDRAFHRHFLESGNLPVAMVRERFAHLGLI